MVGEMAGIKAADWDAGMGASKEYSSVGRWV